MSCSYANVTTYVHAPADKKENALQESVAEFVRSFVRPSVSPLSSDLGGRGIEGLGGGGEREKGEKKKSRFVGLPHYLLVCLSLFCRCATRDFTPIQSHPIAFPKSDQAQPSPGLIQFLGAAACPGYL